MVYYVIYTQILRIKNNLFIAKIIQCSDFESNSLKTVRIKYLFH